MNRTCAVPRCQARRDNGNHLQGEVMAMSPNAILWTGMAIAFVGVIVMMYGFLAGG